MIAALDAAALFRDFVETIEAGGTIDRDLLGWAAGCGRAYLDGAPRGLTLEQAFGLELGPGALTWWKVSRRAQWGAAVAALAGEHFPGQSPRAQSERIAQRFARYVSGRWRRDRNAGNPYAAGTIDAALYSLARLNDGRQVSARTLQRAIEAPQRDDQP